ncbi:MAG: hypothetical protein JXA06_07665 [Bacteroidetes bacterium]|nr:hypothetical protein [Bacteroidota bacterium]
MDENKKNRSGCITFLAIINAAGLILTIVFWGLVFFKHPVSYPWEMTYLADRANSAVTYAFMIGDIIYSVPLLLLAWIGLWRLKIWGWLAAQMVNALWIYSMTVILFRDAFTSMSPGGILFIPFAVISAWAVPYLWIHRAKFFDKN